MLCTCNATHNVKAVIGGTIYKGEGEGGVDMLFIDLGERPAGGQCLQAVEDAKIHRRPRDFLNPTGKQMRCWRWVKCSVSSSSKVDFAGVFSHSFINPVHPRHGEWVRMDTRQNSVSVFFG